MNFIVFKKAFHIIQRNLLLNIFRSYGISLPDKIANIIRNLYKYSRRTVTMESENQHLV